MNRIKQLRTSLEMKQIDLAKQLKVGQNTISNWETGRTEPDSESLQAMAKIFDTSIDYILGHSNFRQNTPASIIRIPVLGAIPAGIPLEAIEEIIGWEEIPESMCAGGKEYFALEVKGDSMWPDYLPGDVVIVRKTPCFESGDVCVVYVNGYDATLKQVKSQDDGSLTLIPRNQSYPPRTYSKEEVMELPVSIAGVVVELRRKIKGGKP